VFLGIHIEHLTLIILLGREERKYKNEHIIEISNILLDYEFIYLFMEVAFGNDEDLLLKFTYQYKMLIYIFIFLIFKHL
jgi:hypothetical protein